MTRKEAIESYIYVENRKPYYRNIVILSYYSHSFNTKVKTMSGFFFLKKRLLHLINKMGYDLTKIAPHDTITEDIDDIEKILYFAKSNKLPYLCNVPVTLLRGHVMAFSFDDVNHPFTIAVLAAKKEKNRKRHIKKVLTKYYETVKPRHVADVLGLSDAEASVLKQASPWLAVHPWEDRTIEDLKEQRPVSTLRDNQFYGKNITIEEGWHLFGPVSEDKLDLEATRLEKVLSSIERKGYSVSDTNRNITAMVLVNEKKQCRWIVYDGQHRTAVLAGLGYKKIPVLVQKIVERNDVELWPGVQSGDFTIETALKVFDRVFYEKTALCVARFIEKV